MTEPLQPPSQTRPADWAAHAVPFIAWLALMLLPGSPSGLTYTLRAAIGLALFLVLRPWRGYPALRLRNLPLAAVVGAAVCLVWIAPECPCLGARWPAWRDLYLKYAVLPWGKIPETPSPAPFAPETCGWTFSVIRLLGSAFVISFIEEFFWRGFVYRWIITKDFRSVDLGRFVLTAFLLTAVLFGVEHDRWLVGILAGLAYGAMAILTRDLWAVGIAHAITNFLLGLYVLATGHHAFW